MVPLPPPAVQDLPRGTKLITGMGFSTILPDLDFETYSEAGFVWNRETNSWEGPPGAPQNKRGLPVIGVHNYATHPSTEVLCLSFDLKDGAGKQFWRPGLPPPIRLFAYLMSGGLIEAHHVMFERMIWENVCAARMGWPAVDPSQWRCAMAKARAYALPGALGKAGDVMRLPIQKDKRGAALITKFCMPRKPTATDPRFRVLPAWEFDPTTLQPGVKGAAQRLKRVTADLEDTAIFGQYNLTDIAAEAELSARCPDLEGEELAWWQVDQACNHRGIAVDVEGLRNCAAIIEQVQAQYGGELVLLTGIDSPSKAAQIQAWLAARGVHLESLDEEAVEGALARTDLTPECRRVLHIRAVCASASVKKVFAMLNQVSADGRMRGLYIFHGARTGRDTGEGPQPTNLPSAGPDLRQCECGAYYGRHRLHCPSCGKFITPKTKEVEWNPKAAEQALAHIATRSMHWVELVFGDALHTVAGCLRALYVAGPGMDFVSTDYNSIEAVGLAMLSGEKWRIETFRTHGKIYEQSAAMMFGVSFEEMMRTRGYTDEQLAQPEWWTLTPANKGSHHPLRKKGKVGELAFGYQGWVGAAKAFEMPGTDEEIKRDILAWRAASPAVVELWGGQERRNGWNDRRPEFYGVEGAFVQAVQNPGTVYPVMRLDGTDTGVSYLCKQDVVYCELPSGRYLHYHRPRLAPSPRGGLEISFEGWNTNPKNGPKGWIRMKTWGGRLVENLVQAICRDILRFACIRLEAAGYPVVMRTYDEIVSEIRKGWGSIQEFEEIVTVPPPWAWDWPIRAPDGWRGERYRK